MDDSDSYLSIAKNLRQWFHEDRPTASAYAAAMLDPQILVPFLRIVYTRLFRNRRYYLTLESAGWGRDQPFYKWLRRYFDTTDVQNPDQSGLLSGRPQPIRSTTDGMTHLKNKFEQEFAAQDTMLIREKERLDTFAAMNGEDNDCYWSYTGPGGGQYLHSVQTKSVGYDGIGHDNQAHDLWYRREHTANPTAMYGALLRKQEAVAQKKTGVPDFGRASQGAWLGF